MDARIGPNAVIQTLRALELLEGPEVAAEVRAASDIPASDDWTHSLVPEAWFVRVLEEVAARLSSARLDAVMAESGRGTAAYVAAHRVPAPIRRVLGWLPPRLAIPLLLSAFRRHAWTFAGAGVFAVEGSYPGTIVLRDAPTCRDGRAAGVYYEAAFQGLVRIAAPEARVFESTCQNQGCDACRFVIALDRHV